MSKMRDDFERHQKETKGRNSVKWGDFNEPLLWTLGANEYVFRSTRLAWDEWQETHKEQSGGCGRCIEGDGLGKLAEGVTT